MSTCEKCRHWGAERVKAIQRGGELAMQARCHVDPGRAAPPLMWQWEAACPRFAADLREYPHTILTTDDPALTQTAPTAGTPSEAQMLGGDPRLTQAAPTESMEKTVTDPVAWRTFDGEGGYEYRSYEGNESYRKDYIARNGVKYALWVEPLFLEA